MKTLKRMLVLFVFSISVLCLNAQGTGETQAAVDNYVSTADPKYIFMFIGDGMSTPQINSAQIIGGNNNSGKVELDKLTFTRFPVVGLQYTQDATSFCPDSASTATSLSSGFKTHSGVIGMGIDKVTEGVTIAEKLKAEKGFRIGIVSTVTLNHATPAAYYAHVANRNDYYDIGLQMVDSGFDYFGGGAINKAEDGGESIYSLLEKAGYLVTSDRDEILSLGPGSGKVYAQSPVLQDDGAMKYAIDACDDELQLKDFSDAELEADEREERRDEDVEELDFGFDDEDDEDEEDDVDSIFEDDEEEVTDEDFSSSELFDDDDLDDLDDLDDFDDEDEQADKDEE